MKILERVKKLKVVLQYVPAVIALFYALSFWRRGDTEGALTLGLLGIGLMLLGILLQTARRFIGNERRFVVVAIIIVFCCSLYMWINGDIYDGLISTLICLFMIANHFSYSQKGTGSRWSTPMWQIYIPIAAGLITFGPLLYLQYKSEDKTPAVKREVGVQQEAVEEASKPDEVPGNAPKNKEPKSKVIER